MSTVAAERDRARDIAVELEQQMAEATQRLTALVADMTDLLVSDPDDVRHLLLERGVDDANAAAAFLRRIGAEP